MTASIRLLEKCGGVPISCITIAQRLGLDYLDLVADMIDDVLERVIKEEGKSQGSMIERKKRQMESLAAMGTGSNDVEGEMDAEEEEEKEDPGNGEGEAKDDKGKRSKGKGTAAEQEEKEKKKKYYKEMKAQKEAQAAAVQAEEDELANAGPSTTELFFLDKENIPEAEARSTARYIDENRQLLILWVAKLFGKADEILKLLGWDVSASCGSFADDLRDDEGEGEKRNSLLEVNGHCFETKKMKAEVRIFHLLRGRALQYAGQHKPAALQYNCVLKLGGNKKALVTAEYELIRVHIALRDYQRAFHCLEKVVFNCFDDASTRFPEAWQLIRKFPLLAYWHLLIHEGLVMLKYAGFGRNVDTMGYALDSDGVLSPRAPVKESEVLVVPRSIAQDKIAKEAAVVKNKEKLKRRFEKDTNLLKTQVSNLIITYTEKLESSKEEFAAAVAGL